MRSRIVVLASGGGSNLQAIIDYFGSRGESGAAEVALVISDREDAAALRRAAGAGIEALVIPHPNGAALMSVLRSREIALIVLAGYLRRIPAEVVAHFRNRIVNIHPGPLPDFGGAGMYGARVHAAVIDAGLRETAVTVHFVDEDYDSGEVIARWPVPVDPDDTPRSLAERVLEVEHFLYPRVIDLILALHSLNTVPTT